MSYLMFWKFVIIPLIFFVIFAKIDARDIRARYPVTFSQPDVIDQLGVDYITAKTPSSFAHKPQDYQYREGTVRRKPQSSRFQNIFSNSMVIHGSEFSPKELHYGRMNDRRRETFRWAPPPNILESTYVNY